MAKKDYRSIHELFTKLKSERDEYSSLWRDISYYTGIGVDVDNFYNNKTSNKSKEYDEFVDDPTSVIAVNQAGDYLMGIIWGTGNDAFNIVPSNHVTELATEEELDDWFGYATSQTLFHMNHSESGLDTAMRPYAYDQFSFGTSGIGAFPNKAFENGIDDNALLFRGYGVDNIAIDEGKSGLVEYVFVVYDWRINRIVNEFATKDGVVSDKAISSLPKQLQDAWKAQDFNKTFSIVFGVFPRDDFEPQLEGKRGTRYRGVWFLDDPKDNSVFHEESFKDRPISICRQVKIRSEVYGRSSGTMLISSIRSVNFMVGTVIEILEKLSRPSLGLFGSSIFGDSVLDTSADGMTIFNATQTAGQNPTFPLYDVGDPTGIINFLIPYLNEKIATGFKVDSLLDFNSSQDMTATESLQRYAIRGKSLAGMLKQQKTELLFPLSKRCISILMGMGELGIDPNDEPERAVAIEKIGKGSRVIPQAVLDVIKSGKPWFDIKFNNEMERLSRTEAVENLLQVINSIGAIASMYPQIIEAVDWHKLLSDINDNLDPNNQIIMGADEFKKKLEALAQQQQAMAKMQMAQGAAQIGKDSTQATKNQKEAENI